ncbi:hypothetical protein CFC21_102020 [Triticum aestivum]|uniref:Uncharacterized protein n=2 Tax=Triticum aestivum TaxID=4565 RepID=A0A9R1N4M5_WHEAT|nr:anthranilate O-methyltransferase 3-like [Triticum aestivum]KAF7100514.1 hypothetical protein CFC21_102020 [Triticum aestivum]
MKMDSDFHMAKGEGETSYVKNSTHQKKALIRTKPVLEKAVIEVCMDLLHPTMIVVDLGCSSGENTLIFVSNVIEAICSNHDKLRGNLVELQVFLNDLPGNDFNRVFQSLEQFKESITVTHKLEALPPFYIAGLPGSFYTKLFPRHSVHLFHSSYCLHWRSELPDGFAAKREMYLNKGNIYIARTTPPSVVKLYQEHFEKDMLLFLKLRYKERVLGGQMVLTFLGRKTEDVYNGDMNQLYGLIAQSLEYLVEEGLLERGKLNSFNLPFYGPSLTEVKMVIKQSGLFDINHVELFESNWDPHDNSESNEVRDPLRSGMNVSKSLRAVMEPLFTSHFGESMLDKLFDKFTYNVAEHLAREKTKYSIIFLSLKRK